VITTVPHGSVVVTRTASLRIAALHKSRASNPHHSSAIRLSGAGAALPRYQSLAKKVPSDDQTASIEGHVPWVAIGLPCAGRVVG
jgi:hypothetical protein